MGRMYDNSPKSKYSPLSNTKLVEAARGCTDPVHAGDSQSVGTPEPVDSRVVVDIDSLEIEQP